MQPQARRGNQAWDVLDSKESRCACASLSHSTGHRDLLAGSPVQEDCLFFREVNELWHLLYFSASNSPFCRVFSLLLWGGDWQAESETFELVISCRAEALVLLQWSPAHQLGSLQVSWGHALHKQEEMPVWERTFPHAWRSAEKKVI